MAIQQLTGANVALTTATNEYSLVIPPQASNLSIRFREATGTVKVYKVGVGNGGTPANFITVDASKPFTLLGVFGGQTIYLMGDTNATHAEAAYLIDN